MIWLLINSQLSASVKNSGALIKNGAGCHLTINGSYLHQTNGRLINDGSIHFSGHWINNDTYTGEEHINNTGELNITGTSTLSGSADKETFENIHISAQSSFTIHPNFTCHLYGDVSRENETSEFILASNANSQGHFYTESDITDTITVSIFLGGNSWSFITLPFNGYTPYRIFGSALDNSIGMAYYDEQKRATSKEDWEWCNSDDTLMPGKGYIIWSNNDTTITLKGIPQLNRKIHLGYSNTSNGYWHNGWNLVGNYNTTPIDVYKPNSADRPERTNVDAAIYVYNRNTDDYWVYVDGIGVNTPPDGSKVAPYQAFFMKSNNSSALVNFKGSERITNNSIVLRNNSLENEIIRVSLKDKSGSCQTIIRFKNEATTNFDSDFDAYQINTTANQPLIYSYTNDLKLAVNSLPINYNNQIPLITRVNAPETFQLLWHIENINNGYDIYLLDKNTNQLHTMNQKDSLTFSLNENNNNNRFSILRIANTATLVDQFQTQFINLVQNGSKLNITPEINIKKVTLLSIDGKIISTQVNHGNGLLLNTSGYKGIALIKIDFDGYFKTYKKIIH